MDHTIIKIKNLKKSFKQLPVLKGIDLSIKEGSIFALLGSNGAGKTTIVNILSTLMTFDEGEISVCGFDIEKQADKVCGCISLTGQYAAVDGLLSGRENLTMMAKLYHMKHHSEKVEELLTYFQLQNAADRRVQTYSGGMRRRLDIAMSLLSSPKIIFLDEPTTGLDPQNRIAMWNIVKALAEKGTTVFLTTQYLEEAEQLADHIAILDQGKLIAEGTSEELKQQLPQGFVEITFPSVEQLQLAKEACKSYRPQEDSERILLTIETKGTIEEMSDILHLLQQYQVTVSGFTQKLPSLEDVFLNLIQQEEPKDEDN